jgi:DNA (cytosine-5)-methyltransferase 1
MIKVGSDFSGVGAFNQALMRLGVEYKEIFACDMDKFARQTFIHNYGEPKYYPTNVYMREIPLESLDIYMTSPPCQAFSLAGKRLGKEDKRGILFFNSLEFIEKNRPRYFIFENVKGLISDNGGKTFSEWVNMLGGKSVNGNTVMFGYADSVPYHLYWKVLNAKEHGVPQNRERVFLIGIRDDADNNFRFPAEEHLTKRLKDVLESEVDEKYFLSADKINQIQKWTAFKKPFECNLYGINENEIMSCLTARGDGNEHSGMKLLKIPSANSKGYEEATEGDSINLEFPESKTRRGRFGKGVAQCNMGVIIKFGRSETEKQRRKETYKKTGKDSGSFKDKELILAKQDYSDTILANANPQKEGLIFTNKIRRLTPRECFRLMDFPDTFSWPVSDSQAYKQAGNSIVVNVLYKILKNLLNHE